MAAPKVRRHDVLSFRFRRHQLDREPGAGNGPSDVALLDYGVQDTGPDGAAWALALRGAGAAGSDEPALAWTLRGAPHAYRRSDLAAVAVATAPLSEADATKRIFDAAKPLKAAGIPTLEALRVVAGHLRDIVSTPTVKGEVSGLLTERLDQPYLRFCRPCDITHVYEMPFRLAALQAGLELEAGTSPPVLRRIAGVDPQRYGRLAGEAEPRLDVIRNHLHFYGPTGPKDVATFLDAPVKEVQAHWLADAVEVAVENAPPVGLVGPYDPYLQLRDRELLVAGEGRRKGLWPVLGRPGAIVVDGEVIGTWRSRTSGRKLTVRIAPWEPLHPRDRALVEGQAERLATHRGTVLGEVPFE